MEDQIKKNKPNKTIIQWRKDVYNAKKISEQSIIDAKNIPQSEIDKMIKNKDNEISSILTLRQYSPRITNIVIRYFRNKNKIEFRFWFDHFSWNEYSKDVTNTLEYNNALKDIENEIIKEFPILFKGVNFMTYLESLRYWEK